MIFNSVHKTIAVLMAFVVLFSTFSFSVEKHYCGSHLVDAAIFSKPLTCGMDKGSKTTKKKSCCKDEIEIVKGLDELKLNTFDYSSSSFESVLIANIYFYTLLFESLPKRVIPHKNYIPPNLISDIQVLDAVYLI